MIPAVGEPDTPQPVLGDRPRLTCRETANTGEAQHDIAHGRQVWKQIVALEYHPHAGALMGERASGKPLAPIALHCKAEKLAIEAYLSPLEILQEIDAAQESGLSRTARADDRYHIARKDIEVDAAQDGVRTERLCQAFDGQDGIQDDVLAQTEAAFDPPAARADGEIDGEIERAGERIEFHGLERTADNLLCREQKLSHPDRRKQR